MFRHLFLLLWNRKRANMLLITEILISFVILFGVGTIGVQLTHNYFEPHGFDHRQVWRLNIAAGQGEKMPRPLLDEALRHVKALPGVVDVALTSANTPFIFSTRNGQFWHGEKQSSTTDMYDTADEYANVMGIHIREGRWFRRSDDALQRRPIVITKSLRDALFEPGEIAVGKTISTSHDTGPAPDNPDAEVPKSPQLGDDMLIVGVADNFRAHDDLSQETPSAWMRLIPFDTTHWEGAAVVLRVQPGAGAALKHEIVRTIARSTRNWTTQISTLSEDLAQKNKYTITPVVALAIVCLFLIVNVALGLFGVLWYNINQRRSEIGLRRAIGATGWTISTQFLAETLILALFGVILGAILALQFPLLGAFDVPAGIYLTAIGLSAIAIFLLAGACALQPSRLAARVLPARALREE